MKNIRALFLFCLCFIFITSCNSFRDQEKRVTFNPFDAEEAIELTKLENQKNIWGLSIRINGKFNGETELYIGENDNAYRKLTDFNSETNNFEIKNYDWYTDKCFLKFVPVNANKGEVEVTYHFHD